MQAVLTSELLKTAVGLFFDILDILISILPAAPFRVMLSQLSECPRICQLFHTL